MIEVERVKHMSVEETIKALEQQPFEDAISRQAVDELSKELVHTTRDKADFLCNFWEGLQKLPPVTPKQQTCEDAISRQAVLDQAIDYGSNTYLIPVNSVKALPPVTPQPKTGKWIDIMVGDMPAQACDQCNTFYPLSYTGGGHRYCPNCGARMQEVKENG